MRRLLPAILIVLVAAAPAPAALDPELKKPYQLQVVLHVADNRALTPLFQEQFERALGDQLRQTFGALAQVEVTRKHPLLDEVVTRGLEQALDGWDETSDVQTHFVLLDYAAGQYRLQTRAHDGMTGQTAAVVRRILIGDRALVPLQAARLVEQGFAPVGTVTSAAKGKDVRLAVKGGGLGVALDRWVKPGDVFSVSRVVPQSPGRMQASRVPWALLEVTGPPRDGVCRCRYFHRFREDDLRDTPGTLGFRARKLGTTTGPVRLRLVDEDTYQPIDGAQVQVFRAGTKEKVELTTNREGLAVTREPFAHLALIVLPREGVQLPVEVADGRTIVCRVKTKGGSESLAALEYRRDAWLRRLYDDLRLVPDRVKELNQELSKSLQAAKEMAAERLDNLKEELSHLTAEHGELKRLAQENKLPAGKFDLREGEQRLAELRGKQKNLEDFIGRLDKAIKEGEENARLSQEVEQARLLEAQADFARAIAVYEKILKESPGQTKVRERLDDLKQKWALKGPKHTAARAFAYDTWPKLDVAGLKKGLDTAKQTLATLKEVDDRLTAQKMLQSDAVHAANLKKELDRLRQKDTEDSRNQAKVISQVAAGLRQLHEELTALVGPKKE
jgi:hypothetical protein